MTNESTAMWLAEMKGMTPLKCYALYQYVDQLTDILSYTYQDINDCLARELRDYSIHFIREQDFLEHRKRLPTYQARIGRLKKDQHILLPSNPFFPEKLKTMKDCPIVLFAKSSFITSKKGKNNHDTSSNLPKYNIGIVGARRCSLYGKDTAYKIAGDLAEKGVGVISGLAYGVDVAAHKGALAKGGFTIAVLGGGLNQCYPKQHQRIFEEIAEKGMLISEEWFETKTESFMFPKRNRIISGISDGVLVVEAAMKSGSLITADFALEQGRDVFAVPGRILDPKAMGSNGLLRQGAKAVFGVEEILEEYCEIVAYDQSPIDESEKKLEEKEKIVYSCISYEPVHEESIMRQIHKMVEIGTDDGEIDNQQMKSYEEHLMNMTAGDVTMSLMVLELKGLIKKISGCYYARSED